MEFRDRFELVSAPLKGAERVMLKGIFLNRLKDEIQAELKLHDSESLDELMDCALLLEEKNADLRNGGLSFEERKGWRDKEGPMG